jgi:tetratricopeptide (TPR) repeat protein
MFNHTSFYLLEKPTTETNADKPRFIPQSYDFSKDYFKILLVADIHSIHKANDDSEFKTKVKITNNGILEKQQKKYIHAEVLFQRVLDIDPKYFYALWNMGDTLQLEQPANATGAKHFFNLAEQIKPSSIEPPLNDTSFYQGELIKRSGPNRHNCNRNM